MDQTREAGGIHRRAAVRVAAWLAVGMLLWAGSALSAGPHPAKVPLAPVSHRVHAAFTPLLRNRETGRFETLATARNDSGHPLFSPLRLVITQLEPDAARVVNAGGKDARGRPYFELPLINGTLRPAETTAALPMQFEAPASRAEKKRDAVRFRYQLYAALRAHNDRPTADAGPDQTAHVGETVTLNGSGSADSHGDPLRYRWSVTRRPEASQAGLAGADSARPRLTIDRPGDYEIVLTVTDGALESLPDTVVVSTVNSKPVAVAGADRTVFVGARVRLDGAASTDRDGDPLRYRWTLKTKPAASLAELVAPTTATPDLPIDQGGRYEAELTVDDGALTSDPDTVFIDTENSRPVAEAGATQTAIVGAVVQLDGGASHDADGDALGFTWSLLSLPAGSQTALSEPRMPKPQFTPDRPGMYIAQLQVDDGKLDSLPDTTEVSVSPRPNRAPTITSTPPLQATLGQLYGYRVEAADADGDPLTYSLQVAPTGLVIDPLSGSITWTPIESQVGEVSVRIAADDGHGAADTQSFALTVRPDDRRTVVPAVTGLLRPVAEGTVLGAGLRPGSVRFETDPRAEGTVIGQDPAAGGVVLRGTELKLVISLGPETMLPPSPDTVAPRIDATLPTTTAAATEFLFSGAHPLQTGVAAATMDPQRVSVLRGRVLDRAAAPLSGVVVTVQHHAEYGQTLTRTDGAFDLAVNGGGSLVVNFHKAGYLPAQRPAAPAWQDYAALEEVVLVDLDPRTAAIALTPDAPMQTAQGSVVTDQDGTRQTTAFFPAGMQAAMTLPDGTVQALSRLTVRATEYTVGNLGPQSLPGALPPTSGYTYAVEWSADEALAAGAETVRFDRPVPVYVDNFLGFPVGTPVPAGYYDRHQAAWIPAANGRVIQVVGTTGPLAELDTDGDGAADHLTKLEALAISAAEREKLATLFPVGSSFWRVPVSHFTPWDFNWPYGPPADAKAPLQSAPRVAKGLDDPDCQPGSIIECQTQTLGEVLPIAGTPFTLHYRSDRTAARQTADTLELPLSGPTLPASLKRIELEIQIAGRLHRQTLPAATNQSTRFTWDGVDGYGRKVSGAQPATVRIGYVYDGVYQTPNSFGNSFGALSGVPITGSRTRREITLWQTHKTSIGGWNASPLGFGGWSLNVHHVYDPNGRVLYRGDGGRQSAEAVSSSMVTTVAGTRYYYCGDGGPAINACLPRPFNVAATPSGGYYIADNETHGIRYVDPKGIINHFAGAGGGGFSGDGGAARSAQLYSPGGMAVAEDGCLYVADRGNHRIRRIDPAGVITTVAGNGVPGYGGDGGPATSANLNVPQDVAVGPDRSLYIADEANHRIRKVSPDGVISTLAGIGIRGFSGDGGPASRAQVYGPLAVAAAQDGSVILSDTGNYRIRRVRPDGIITTIAGNSGPWDFRDAIPATQGSVYGGRDVALGPDQTVYFLDAGTGRVRRIGHDGIVTTLAGNGQLRGSMDELGDGQPARQLRLGGLYGMAVAADGSILISDNERWRVRRILPSLPISTLAEIALPSRDGAEVYFFDQGRHVRTLDALTQAVLFRFRYDAQGLLISVTDVDGRVTTIERDGGGNPTAIVAPFGQRTALSLDTNGRLAAFTAPGPETHRMTYSAEGLLTRWVDPEGHATTMTYDDQGRLIDHQDAAGGAKSLSRSDSAHAYTIRVTNALGETHRYLMEEQPDGTQKRRTTFPDGTWTETLIAPGGERKTRSPDGTVLETTPGGDPRFGMQAPMLSSLKLTTGGLAQTMAAERTVRLSNPRDPFSLTQLTDQLTVNGRATTQVYDAATKTITATSPAGRSGKVALDAMGRVIRSETPGLLDIHRSYDAQGRLSKLTQGAGAEERAVTFRYAANGDLAAVTDALGDSFESGYDPAGRVIRQTLADGREIRFAYDRNGNLVGLTPPDRQEHRFRYTPVALAEDYQPPWIAEGAPNTHYQYDLDRKPTRIVRPDGLSLDFAYDGGGRIDTITTPEGNSEYRFDPTTGQLTATTTPDGSTLSFTYSGALLAKTTWAGGVSGSVGFTYDNDFRITAVHLNDANPVAYQYDADSLLVKAGALSLSRNAQNGLLTGTVLGATADSLQYDGFGEVTEYQAKANGVALFSIHYSYDKGGRIIGRTETHTAESHAYEYGYDRAGRLSEIKQDGVVRETYGYDANGNRTHLNGVAIAHYDEQDRLLDAHGTRYSYTAHGELSQTSRGAITTTYRYDTFGNLRTVELPGGSRIDYLIDGAHRRIGKKIDGALVQGWLYQDALKPIAEFDGSGHLISRFVYATHANVPDYLIRGGNTYRIVTDPLGSPRRVVNAADGTVIQQIDYDPWGQVTYDSNPGFQPFGFAGGLYDRDTALLRFGARDYHPETARFTAKDPILFAGGNPNLYGYALNDPVNASDPSGLWAWGDAFNDDIINTVSGFGDGLSSSLSLGLISTQEARQFLGIDGGVRKCSDWYLAGTFSGYAWGASTLWSAGLNGGNATIFWSGYSQNAQSVARPLGIIVEKTPIGKTLEFINYKLQINVPSWIWSMASATFAANARGPVTAIIRNEGRVWSKIEKPILQLRGITTHYR